MSPKTPAQQLNRFIARFEPRDQRLIRACRKALRWRLPGAYELVYDNYNFFVIGYGPTERPSDAVPSLTARAGALGVCFFQGVKLPDPSSILRGSGNQTRFIRLESAEDLNQPAVEALITAALARAKPLPGGPPRLIIHSVSVKQRPRRKSARKRTAVGVPSTRRQ
jgi:hypothetical protein